MKDENCRRYHFRICPYCSRRITNSFRWGQNESPPPRFCNRGDPRPDSMCCKYLDTSSVHKGRPVLSLQLQQVYYWVCIKRKEHQRRRPGQPRCAKGQSLRGSPKFCGSGASADLGSRLINALSSLSTELESLGRRWLISEVGARLVEVRSMGRAGWICSW